MDWRKELKSLDGGVALHIACHARAQEMGPKSAVMLRMIPDLDVLIMERCSATVVPGEQ